jgi:DNA-binding MarR family transcriptional regulator
MAMDIVTQQGKRHMQLMQNYENGQQLEAAYDYQRWQLKTEELLRQYISVEEAKRFLNIIHRPYNVFRHDEVEELYLFYDEVQAFLLGLLRGIMANQIEVNPAALQSKRYRVLRKLYDMVPNNKHGDIIVSDLATALGMDYHEANRILLYWEDKGMVHSPSDESVALTPYAIDEIESTIQHPNKGTKHFSPTVINYTDNRISIGGDNSGQVLAGNQGSQTMHSPISEILPKLAEFIKAVKEAEFPDKDDVVRDLEKAQELAHANPNVTPKEAVWKRIQGKLEVAKTTMEIVGFAYNSLPYWPMIWKYFFV